MIDGDWNGVAESKGQRWDLEQDLGVWLVVMALASPKLVENKLQFDYLKIYENNFSTFNYENDPEKELYMEITWGVNIPKKAEVKGIIR